MPVTFVVCAELRLTPINSKLSFSTTVAFCTFLLYDLFLPPFFLHNIYMTSITLTLPITFA